MIDLSSLLTYAPDTTIRKTERVVEEARARGDQTAFLSHSHTDAVYAKRVQAFLEAQGWRVYIDWEDATMPSKPDKETALKIKDRIKRLDWFLFLATKNSMSSRWCPWEIGIADGVKANERIIVIPTRDGYTNYGSEYLDLYRYIHSTTDGGFATFDAGRAQNGTMLRNMRR
ncbi:MAG: toll/interleukin-1 receptor domain-containing protein [Sulfitobacter sp.]|jgi:hypothetical protein|uniref:Toll/interleukin-1 receptor domain-containing protein n=1 Tax=Psychromarinibacter halotolerans TaxID=1775175 RepID=A0ABV7GI84_9RHOB|nr:toll/interleukin-1 receptor domain-containing protein [Sulfitobacter sp. LC.270.F.C4]WOI13927.1 toll/interleukin-1 receptor domain-containing protein [Sulfitobacter sp. LC.270.F.C4]